MSESEPSIVSIHSIQDAQSIVRSSRRIIIAGARSKRCLTESDGSLHDHPVTLVSMKDHAGITQYEPSEFTFTAKAGTSLHDAAITLGQSGQYLPFDPMLRRHGATLGGTIAAGLSGPGRFRFGGLRDFILGATVVLGNGDVVRVGGKVVKNAAGFDVPKLLVGSLGRFGIITEVTMKVFPQPAETVSAKATFNHVRQVGDLIGMLAGSSLELDAIEVDPDGRTIWVRIAGPADANAASVSALQDIVDGFEVVEPTIAARYYDSITELDWAGEDVTMLKIPTTLDQLALVNEIASDAQSRVHVSAAGNVAWMTVADEQRLTLLDQRLDAAKLPALMIRRGSAIKPTRVRLGRRNRSQVSQSIRIAFDPEHKFAGDS